MIQSQLNAMKCNIDGIIMGLKDQILLEVDQSADTFDDAIQTLVAKGRGMSDEEITNQFNISYKLIVDNINRIVALSIIDKPNIDKINQEN